MKVTMPCLVVLCLLPFCQLVAQDSELALPDAKMIVGLAETDEAEKLKLSFREKSAPFVWVTETIEQSYTLSVPYTEMVERDGKEVAVTKYRTETRTRAVPVTRMAPQTQSSWEYDQLKCFTIAGEEVPEDKMREHFDTKQPVVCIYHGGEINEFFSQVFNEDVMVIELPDVFVREAGTASPATVRPAPMPRRRPRR